MGFKEDAKSVLEARAGVVEQRRGFIESLAGTTPNEEQRTKIAAFDTDIDAKAVEARSIVEQGERDAEARSLMERAEGLGAPAPSGEQRDGRDLSDEFRGLARGEVREVLVDLPVGVYSKRTATAGDHTGINAGITSPAQFVAQVIESMRVRSDFFSRARVLTTSGGEELDWPVKTGRPTVGQVAENTTYPKSDESWGKTKIGAYKYGVIVEATQEIVDDSALNILDILATDAGEAVADDVVADMLTGDGNGKPHGWLVRAASALTAANMAGVSVDNVITLQHSIIAPYRRNAVFATSDAMVAHLRTLKDNNGQYLWQPSVQAGVPDALLGVPIITDPNVKASGAGVPGIAYGDPSKYLIRQAKQLRIVRSDEYGFDRDVIAFKVTWRGDGDLFDLASVKSLTLTA